MEDDDNLDLRGQADFYKKMQRKPTGKPRKSHILGKVVNQRKLKTCPFCGKQNKSMPR